VKLLTTELAITLHAGNVTNAAITTDRQPIISAEIGEKGPLVYKRATRKTLTLGPKFADCQNIRTRANSLAENFPVRLPTTWYKTIRSDT
jgi:hypothetical protein